MRMNIRERKELALSKVLIIIFAVLGLAVVVWFAWIRPAQKAADVSSFAECVAADNPVQQSYPEVCVSPNGQHFTNPAQTGEDPVVAKQKIIKTPLSQVAADLHAVIVAEVQKQAPSCVQDGVVVDKNKQAVNPAVAQQASGYAIMTVGCDAGKPTLFGQDKAHKWQVIAVSKDNLFDCDVLSGTDTSKEFFQTATASGVCTDKTTGRQLDIATLHI